MILHAGLAQAAIKTRWIDYKQGDATLSGYLAYDDAIQGRRPGILMVYDRSGFSPGTLADAEMIAKLGYVVLAEDIYGKGVLPKTTPEMVEQTEIYEKDLPLMRARALAGLDVLKAQQMVDPSKIATIGYCFGGVVGIELVETGAPILGLISVHGAYHDWLTPEGAKNIKGRVLILHGAEDMAAPLDTLNTFISQLRSAKVDFEVNLYSGAGHAFTEQQHTPSEVRADDEYKTAMARFLKDLFAH
jgi:dienelactone hydrolase